MVAGALALPAAAGAGPAWLAPVQVGEAGNIAECPPVVAMDPQGDTFLAWAHREGATWSVELAVRPAGGGWQPPAVISQPTVCLQGIAADARGDAVVLWEFFDGKNSGLASSYRAAGGGWQSPVTLAEEATSEIVAGSVAMDPGGDAIAVWRNDSSHSVESRFMPAGGGWQPQTAVSAESSNGYQPAVAMDPAGDAIAVWRHYPKGGAEQIQSATRLAGHGWGSTLNVDAEAAQLARARPVVAVDAAGDAFAAFASSNGSNAIVQASELPAGGAAWGAATELSAPGQDAESPQIAADAFGGVAVVWERFNGSNVIAQGALKPSRAGWSAVANLSEAGQNAGGVTVAMSGGEQAFAVWRRSNGANKIVQSALGYAGSWQAPVNLSTAGHDAYNPAVAADGGFDAIAAWEYEGSWLVEAAAYDGSGPAMSGLSIPGTGIAGVPVSFFVTPLDAFSALSATHWSFGDPGEGAAGTSVTHAYAAAGTYNVNVTSADVLGNSSTLSGTIVIAPAPAAVKTPAPALGALRQSAARWREGSRLARISARRKRVPVGTTFSFTLNEPASLKLAFTQRVGGRQQGRKCVAQSRRNARGRACKRTVVRGTLVLSGHGGLNKVSFKGRLSRARKLAPGSYTLLLSASNAFGTSASRSIAFAIVR
jgi:hypothetical protein